MSLENQILSAYWRTGRKVGRTIYAMHERNKPSDDDVFIGVLDYPSAAQAAVSQHNAVIDAVNGEIDRRYDTFDS